jgi:hypothetical protein
MEEIKIVMIDETDTENEPTPSKDTLVGILFPTHGFMPPWSMIKFLLRMRRQNGVPALCAATRGGIKVGPLRIPGAAGLGTFLAAFLMIIIGSVPVISYLLYRLHEMYYKIPTLGYFFPYITIYIIDCIAALVLSYLVFWYLIRIPMVNTVFTYTTLTHYYRRYHQPETKLKHMAPKKTAAN